MNTATPAVRIRTEYSIKNNAAPKKNRAFFDSSFFKDSLYLVHADNAAVTKKINAVSLNTFCLKIKKEGEESRTSAASRAASSPRRRRKSGKSAKTKSCQQTTLNNFKILKLIPKHLSKGANNSGYPGGTTTHGSAMIRPAYG